MTMIWDTRVNQPWVTNERGGVDTHKNRDYIRLCLVTVVECRDLRRQHAIQAAFRGRGGHSVVGLSSEEGRPSHDQLTRAIL